MRLRLLALAVCASALSATTANAGALPHGGVTAAEVAGVLKDGGATTEITTDSTGDPMIKTSFGKSNFRVLFYGCSTEKRCKSIQFSAAWDLKDGMTAAKANEWNYNKRFGRVGLDDENDPFLSMDVYLEDGATTEALSGDVIAWEATMLGFMEFAAK